MKRFLHNTILFLSFALAGNTALAQNPFALPTACVGLEADYRVDGFSGSTFQWSITDPNGNILDPSHYSVHDLGEEITVYWNHDLPGGTYTFTVVEHTISGCTGEPWEENIVVNSPTLSIPFAFVNEFFEVCRGSEIGLDPGDFINYLWMEGTDQESNNRLFYTGEAGTYEVRLVGEVDEKQFCAFHDITLDVNELPQVSLGNDTVLFGTQTLVLDVYNPDFDRYNWSTGSISSTITVEGGFGDQIVSVTVVDYNGCEASDDIRIESADYTNLVIPKAFIPRSQTEHNRKWYFPAPTEQGTDVYAYINNVDVSVFNRWGKLVWESSGMFNAWDGRDLGGRELPMDSYHYIIRFRVDDKTFTYKGNVTIIR